MRALEKSGGPLLDFGIRGGLGHLFNGFFRRFAPSLHLQGDRFGISGGIGQRFAEIFFLGVDGDPLDLIAVAQGQDFEQSLDIGSLLVARRCLGTREQTVVARFVEFAQGFHDLLAQLIGVATLGVDKRDHIEVKRSSFKIILGECFLGFVDLLARQGILFFLVQ